MARKLYTVSSTHTGEQHSMYGYTRKAVQAFIDFRTTPAPTPAPVQRVMHIANYQPVYYPQVAPAAQHLANAAD